MSGDAEPDEYSVQEALAEAAYAAGDWVGYRRHLESVGAWPPNQSASLHEFRAIATGDEAAMRSMLERNAERGSIDAVMQLARDAYRAGDVDEAQRLLERAARFDDPWMILIFGCVASDGGDAAGARWHFERSAALGDEDGAYELALLDRDEGDEPAAVRRGGRWWAVDRVTEAVAHTRRMAHDGNPAAIKPDAGVAPLNCSGPSVENNQTSESPDGRPRKPQRCERTLRLVPSKVRQSV